MARLSADAGPRPGTAVDPETGLLYRCRAPRPLLLLVGSPLLLVVCLVLPFVVRTSAAATVGLLAFPLLLLCLAGIVLKGSSSYALDGTVVTSRHALGSARFDLAGLHAVHGQRVSGRHGDLHSLQLRDVTGAALEVTSAPGFPADRTLRRATAHLVHRQVRAAVLAGVVPRVSSGACDVLGLPGTCARGKVEGLRSGTAKAFLLVLVLLGLSCGYVALLTPLLDG